MADLDLGAIAARAAAAKERADRATMGPWRAVPYGNAALLPIEQDADGPDCGWQIDAPGGEVADCGCDREGDRDDAAFIAAARSDVPALAEDVAALVAEVEQLRFEEVEPYPVVLADLRDEIDQLRAGLAAAREALREFEEWASGYATPRTGMGAGMHVERWPPLHPGAIREMLHIARCALVLSSALERRTAASVDLDLLRRFAAGEGGRRTGVLMREGLIEVRVTDAGRAILAELEDGEG